MPHPYARWLLGTAAWWFPMTCALEGDEPGHYHESLLPGGEQGTCIPAQGTAGSGQRLQRLSQGSRGSQQPHSHQGREHLFQASSRHGCGSSHQRAAAGPALSWKCQPNASPPVSARTWREAVTRLACIGYHFRGNVERRVIISPS